MASALRFSTLPCHQPPESIQAYHPVPCIPVVYQGIDLTSHTDLLSLCPGHKFMITVRRRRKGIGMGLKGREADCHT